MVDGARHNLLNRQGSRQIIAQFKGCHSLLLPFVGCGGMCPCARTQGANYQTNRK